ncbi:EamA family transporter RarD [bacterium]|nr:MAG: EamA family transporter RarD [bacterium]
MQTNHTSRDVHGSANSRLGAIQGLTAYLMWGCFPLYFKAVASVSAPEVLAHRIFWSTVFLLGFVFLTGRLVELRGILRNVRTLAILGCATLLLSINWLVFIKAVADGRVLESSLGYYINPLVSILLGFIFLRERLTPLQKVSIALAAVGVLLQTAMVGRVPMVSLILAFSFGLYGLVHKSAKVPALTGLTVEMMLTAPLAVTFLTMLMAKNRAVFMTGNTGINVLLAMAGVITATPLIFYGSALNRLKLSTMGIMQYIVPTGHFLWAVLAFGETFTLAHLGSFGFIWAGLVLYTYDTFAVMRPTTQAAGQL